MEKVKITDKLLKILRNYTKLFDGIEMSEEYIKIASERIKAWNKGGEQCILNFQKNL